MLEQIFSSQGKGKIMRLNVSSSNRLSVLYYELKSELSYFGYQSFEEFKQYVNDSDDPVKTIEEWQLHANRR